MTGWGISRDASGGRAGREGDSGSDGSVAECAGSDLSLGDQIALVDVASGALLYELPLSRRK